MTEGLTGTSYQLYQQPDPLRDEPEEHSWDREIDRLRAQDEGEQTHQRHVLRLAEATAKHEQQLAEAQQESGGQIDLQNLSLDDRSSLLTLIALYGVASAVGKFLERRVAETHVDGLMVDFEARLAKGEHHGNRP